MTNRDCLVNVVSYLSNWNLTKYESSWYIKYCVIWEFYAAAYYYATISPHWHMITIYLEDYKTPAWNNELIPQGMSLFSKQTFNVPLRLHVTVFTSTSSWDRDRSLQMFMILNYHFWTEMQIWWQKITKLWQTSKKHDANKLLNNICTSFSNTATFLFWFASWEPFKHSGVSPKHCHRCAHADKCSQRKVIIYFARLP